jgi:hypothetical protein
MLLNQVFWSLGLGILFGLGNVMLNEMKLTLATLLSNLEMALVSCNLNFEAHINVTFDARSVFVCSCHYF